MSPDLSPLLFINILLFLFFLHTVSSVPAYPVNGTCRDTCGTISVKFPFGTGSGCGHPDFARYIKCNSESLEFSTGTGIYSISSIDYTSNSIIVTDPFMSTCSSMQNSGSFSLDRASPFSITEDNIIVLLGCSGTSPVFDADEDLCATGSGSRVCRGLYSCKGVSGIGLQQNAPASSCCVYDSPTGLGSGYALDLPKLQCSSYTSIYGFGGNEGDPMKWKFGISLQYNDSYTSDACNDCENSGGSCGFTGLDESFACICRNGRNSTTNCFGIGYALSGTWGPKVQIKLNPAGNSLKCNSIKKDRIRCPVAVAVAFCSKISSLVDDDTLYLKQRRCCQIFGGMRELRFIFLGVLLVLATLQVASSHGDQPLSRIAIQKATFALNDLAYVKASPSILGSSGRNSEWVTVEFSSPTPSVDDWIGVFSPSNFSDSTCSADNPRVYPPLLCSAPIKVCRSVLCHSCPGYKNTGKGWLKLQLINQRSDFSFALFSGGLLNPKLVAVSNKVAFTNPNAPVYPRLAQGKLWNEMTVTWTSGYGINEAEPFVEWAPKGGDPMRSPAGTLTFDRSSMCGAPARTVGWRDPGYIHTSFLKELWPNAVYTYKLGHKLFNGTYIWSPEYNFRASPYPGQNSLQRIVIFGDMGKVCQNYTDKISIYQQLSLLKILLYQGNPCVYLCISSVFQHCRILFIDILQDEADGSNEYNNFQRGSLNTTKQLIQDLKNTDIVFHIGDICYANGYLSQWDQFTAQIEPIASTVPYMIASGNHERDWPGTGSFYGNMDSGGECGLLGYSSGISYAVEGSFAEPMGRESLQKLWQKYKVDIAIYGHVHNYERICPIYQHICTNEEKHYYKGTLNGTIHVVAGGGGASLSKFTTLQTAWSLYKDYDYGFVKLTAFDHSNLLFDYKKSRDGKVYDSFRISRDYRDILACTVDSCPSTTLAS
ncbi:hypothetical protein Patl1_16680 [Pistacia atlantica]|uniref:Uncharacterized protein n=1 Tax=Pistacia atlantica TaxID=434234 RepID=A0ACC1BB04_9ROSI|nr:hypothetical protein Patl1_16680 [Pistacia atlantica]